MNESELKTIINPRFHFSLKSNVENKGSSKEAKPHLSALEMSTWQLFSDAGNDASNVTPSPPIASSPLPSMTDLLLQGSTFYTSFVSITFLIILHLLPSPNQKNEKEKITNNEVNYY